MRIITLPLAERKTENNKLLRQGAEEQPVPREQRRRSRKLLFPRKGRFELVGGSPFSSFSLLILFSKRDRNKREKKKGSSFRVPTPASQLGHDLLLPQFFFFFFLSLKTKKSKKKVESCSK